MVLKPASKYQIIQYSDNFKNILIDDNHHHLFLYQEKFCKHNFLQLTFQKFTI